MSCHVQNSSYISGLLVLLCYQLVIPQLCSVSIHIQNEADSAVVLSHLASRFIVPAWLKYFSCVIRFSQICTFFDFDITDVFILFSLRQTQCVHENCIILCTLNEMIMNMAPLFCQQSLVFLVCFRHSFNIIIL